MAEIYKKSYNSDRIHIGDRIKKLLSQKGISQTELAKRLDTTPQSVSNTIKNASMTTDTLQDMLAAIEVTFMEFADVEENNSNMQAQLDEIKKRLDSIEKQIGK